MPDLADHSVAAYRGRRHASSGRPVPGGSVEELVEADRGRLFGIAYRMLGSVTEAEDAVQEAFARLTATDGVADPPAWLTRVVTNVAIDRLRSAQRRRETYVGPWLPEPLLTEDLDPSDVAEAADTLTLAFLTVLERLSPAERAVFLLHDVFGHPHDEIARMLDRSPAAVRKLASRARQRLGEERPRYERDPARQRAVAEAFLAACAGEDLGRLMEVLAPDVVFTADGGGVVSAARRPVHGADRVARMFLGLVRQSHTDGEWAFDLTQVNGQPAVRVDHGGEVNTVFALRVLDGRIMAVDAIRNPAKLASMRGERSPRTDS